MRYKTKTIAYTALSCLGVVATGVAGCISQEKAHKLKKKAKKKKKHKKLKKKEELQAVWSAYIPVTAAGSLTIASIIFGNHFQYNHAKSLVGATALLGGALNRTNQLYSSEEEELELPAPKGSSDRVTFYDPLSDRFFDRTFTEVIDAEYLINKQLADHGEASLNDLYELLHLDRIDEADDIGWVNSLLLDFFGSVFINFAHPMKVINGKEVYILRIDNNPTAEYKLYI